MSRPRLLFILNQPIGDLVLTTGVVSEIAARYDNPRITVVCAPNTAVLFDHMPGVERVIAIARKKKMSGHWFEILPQLLRPWMAVVDFRRTGFAGFLPGKLIRPERPQGRPHKVIETSTALGPGAPPADPRLWFPPDARPRVEGCKLVIAPGAASPYKAWAVDRFIAAARRLTGPGGALDGATVVVAGGPGDRAAARAVAQALGEDRVIDLTHADLMQAAVEMRDADLFIGNDSGATHLAAAAGAPVLALFGPTHPDVYRPWGPRARIVQPPVPPTTGVRVDPSDHSYIEALGVEAVVEAATSLVRDLRATPAS